MRHTHRRLLSLALIAAVAALPACKKAQDAAVEAAMEKTTGMKVDKDGNAVTIKTEQGDLKVATAEEGGSVPLPAGFPSDIYLPDGHKVASAMELGGAQMVNLTTAADMAAVHAAADKAMQDGGWKREMAMQTGDSSSLAYSKDKRQVFYQLMKGEEGGTQLAIRAGTSE